MELYFFRHGLAVENMGSKMPDANRPLTERGIARTRSSAKTLKALGLKPVALYSSPLLRARQTAVILGAALGVAVQIRQEVAPGFDESAAELLLRGVDHNGEVMFVGHEPSLSMTVRGIIGGGDLTLKKGGLARVHVTGVNPLRGELVWLLAPKTLIMLKR